MMSEEYVRKDVYNANISRMEALMRAHAAGNKAMIEAIRGEVKAINAKTEGFADTFTVAVNDMKERIDDLKQSQSNSFARWGMFIAGVVALVQIAISLFTK